MLTKSIRLTDEEASELDDVVRQSGEVEASVLKRAALRGLREDRVDRAVLLYLRGASTSDAATFARVPRPGSSICSLTRELPCSRVHPACQRSSMLLLVSHMTSA